MHNFFLGWQHFWVGNVILRIKLHALATQALCYLVPVAKLTSVFLPSLLPGPAITPPIQPKSP